MDNLGKSRYTNIDVIEYTPREKLIQEVNEKYKHKNYMMVEHEVLEKEIRKRLIRLKLPMDENPQQVLIEKLQKELQDVKKELATCKAAHDIVKK